MAFGCEVYPVALEYRDFCTCCAECSGIIVVELTKAEETWEQYLCLFPREN
jgi:hypothetical protein